ncbi:MAG: hypothetical protein ACRD35_04815 [Candidatus Acidiferrales bacterium]
MGLIKEYGEMWAKNEENIEAVLGSKEGGLGVYILYDGSFPVYVGKGKIRQRLRKARDSKRRGQLWDHFTWYALNGPEDSHDIEALLLRLLPYYLRILNRQRGKFKGGTKRLQRNNKPEPILRAKLLRSVLGT